MNNIQDALARAAAAAPMNGGADIRQHLVLRDLAQRITIQGLTLQALGNIIFGIPFLGPLLQAKVEREAVRLIEEHNARVRAEGGK